MRETVRPDFVEMLVRDFDELIIPTVQFFIVPALHIWLLPCWHVHFISVRLHSPIFLNKAVQPSGAGRRERGEWGIHTFQVLFWEVSTFYLCTISPLHIRGEVCGFWFLAVLIPGTPTRNAWGCIGAFDVSKTEWMRPKPTPNNSFAPFWEMGNSPLPNARPLLQDNKHTQERRWFWATVSYCNIVLWLQSFMTSDMSNDTRKWE